MKTAPSFQFYTADFLGGTCHMAPEEVGAYIRLLCYQWAQGSVPGDRVKLERITGLKRAKLADVLLKFEEQPDGSLLNARLEKTRSLVDEHRARQSQNGRKGGRPAKLTENPPLSSGLDLANPNESSHTHIQSHNTPNGVRASNAGAWPTLDEVKAMAQTVMAPSECAEKFWNDSEAAGWVNRHGQPVVDWRPLFRNYVTAWKSNAAQQHKMAGGKPPPKHAAYDPNTATAGLTREQILNF